MALSKAGTGPIVSQRTWNQKGPSSECSCVIHKAIVLVLLGIYQKPEHLLVRDARNQLWAGSAWGGDYSFSWALHTG